MLDFFNKFFQTKGKELSIPSMRFGRFTDSYKEEEKYIFWDKSISCFEANEYMDSFEFFLRYLADDETNNVNYTRKDGTINFELYQGSKLMIGKMCSKRISAEVKIAATRNFNIGFLRKLVSLNYGLKFSRYALDTNGDITTVFNSSILDCSPYKLYYALKELAINGDKQDDILTSEFVELDNVNTGHIEDVSEREKKIKYEYLKNGIKKVKQIIEHTKLDQNAYPGGISYLLLSFVYRLDYLIVPEGAVMHEFESIHKSFFNQDGDNAYQKNIKILETLGKIQQIGAEDFYPELYNVKSTFGIAAPSTHENLVSIIHGELGNMDWYLKNDFQDIALSIPMYIIGFSLYSFALPAPDRELIELVYRVYENDFFVSLGYESVLSNNEKPNVKKLKNLVKTIIRKYEDQYAVFTPDISILNFKSELAFTRSMLLMIAQMKLEKTNSLVI